MTSPYIETTPILSLADRRAELEAKLNAAQARAINAIRRWGVEEDAARVWNASVIEAEALRAQLANLSED